ncbi:AraC family transcriptional regulator [Phytopseudomonas flavescens]|nr:AraC family transcriptional regulator [Pseudomonas flavescens]
MYRVSVGYVALLLNTFEAEGLDVRRLCHEAGLDMQRLTHTEAFFRRRAVYRLLELAVSESANPAIGLRAYAHFLPGSFQLVGYAMMSCRNLQEALERLVRFTPLLGNGVTVSFSAEPQGQRLCAQMHQEVGSIRPRQFSDAGIAALLGFCNWLTGGNPPRPLLIEFDYPEPVDLDAYRQLADCPLKFGASRASVLFDPQQLLQPLSTANEALSALHERFAESRLSQLRDGSLVVQVRTLITENLDQGGCDMGWVAGSLGVSKRTLQRGLEREGVQFKDVLSEVRRQLSDYYLRHSAHSLAQVAERLGFLEQSSFHKACLRWFGMPPGRYRSCSPAEPEQPAPFAQVR